LARQTRPKCATRPICFTRYFQGAADEAQRTQPDQRQVVDVAKGAITSHVRLDLGHGVIITASITNEAVADLELQKGDEAWAVIKASDVMIGK
jgi:molybdopterin-binding protein